AVRAGLSHRTIALDSGRISQIRQLSAPSGLAAPEAATVPLLAHRVGGLPALLHELHAERLECGERGEVLLTVRWREARRERDRLRAGGAIRLGEEVALGGDEGRRLGEPDLAGALRGGGSSRAPGDPPAAAPAQDRTVGQLRAAVGTHHFTPPGSRRGGWPGTAV